MPVQALQCKECDATYPLEARYVCERCFGPLEVAYDHSGLDADSAKRKIQAGPQTIWRYADFLPFEGPPVAGLPVGLTPLQRAPRLAEALGVGEVFVKNDTANPTHSFKDRVVAVALGKALDFGFKIAACASTGNLANAVAAAAARTGLAFNLSVNDGGGMTNPGGIARPAIRTAITTAPPTAGGPRRGRRTRSPGHRSSGWSRGPCRR